MQKLHPKRDFGRAHVNLKLNEMNTDNLTWIFTSNNAIIYVGLVGRVFTNDLEDLSSIPGHAIPKTLKLVLYTSLLNTQQYKLRI